MERKQQRTPVTVPVSPMAIARPTDRYPDPSWSGWGDPAQTPVLGEDMRALLAQGLGVSEPKTPTVALGDVRLPPSRLGPSAVARARGDRGRRARALRRRDARSPHPRQVARRPLEAARRGSRGCPGSGAPAGFSRRGAGMPAGVLGAADRRGPVRRRHIRGRRARARCRRLRRRRGARPAAHERAGRARRAVAARGARARVARSAGRGTAQRARIHDRPLPPVVRVPDAGRRRGGAVERTGLRRLRAVRRSRAGPASGRAGGHARVRPGTEIGRRPGSSPADPRLGGSARRDHVADGGATAGAGAAGV